MVARFIRELEARGCFAGEFRERSVLLERSALLATVNVWNRAGAFVEEGGTEEACDVVLGQTSYVTPAQKVKMEKVKWE